MMRKTAIVLALLSATALTAPAALGQEPPNPNIPVASAEDPHMRVIAYNPLARTRITGVIGTTTMITYKPGEHIVRIVFGDADLGGIWRGPTEESLKNTPPRNVLYLRPSTPGNTTIQVVTERHDQGPVQVRTYQYDATVKARTDRDAMAEATFGLTYTYPQDDALARQEEAARAREAARLRAEAERPARLARQESMRLAVARERLATSHYGNGDCTNWQYEAEGNAAGRAQIVPDAISDNGQSTTLVYRGDRPVPAFYLPASDGQTETPVGSGSPVSGTIVLQFVAPEIRLRMGEAVLFIRRKGYLPPHCVSDTGTTDQGVVREIRRAPAGALRQAAVTP